MSPFRLFLPFLVIALFMISCGKSTPFSDQIDSTSDGSYVVETNKSDNELLQHDLIVVYRFQSVPNLIAVRPSSNASVKYLGRFSAPKASQLIAQNLRKRDSNTLLKRDSENKKSCYSAYCEAGFDNAVKLIEQKNIQLKPVQIAVIDSGVLASTSPIQRVLVSSLNMTEDNNPNDWLPHATMITSLFAGVVNSYSNSYYVNNTYAPNANVQSIKITFAGDPDNSMKQKYGSMQLAVALDQAVAGGAQLVNLSLTYASRPDENIEFAEKSILASAAKKGVLFVAAAGNDNLNIDASPVYPAGYDANNLIVAGSHTSNLKKAGSSNFGNRVDLSAQGASISVNDKSGGLQFVGGTSFATPLIVSALSLYMGIQNRAGLNVNQVLSDLFQSSNNNYSDIGVPISNYGRLNAQALVQLAINESKK